MKLSFIRPEDRRRSGGSGAGPGFGTDWADTEPACFRSEAFAEDLPQPEADPAAVPSGRSWPAPASRPFGGTTLLPRFASGLAAVLGSRLRTGS